MSCVMCDLVQVLLEFPCELLSALVAGRWAARTSPLDPFLKGFFLRLVVAALVTAVVCPAAIWSLPC